MQSPTVLKAIYSLEHGQSTERLAQTLLRLGVAPKEVEELTENTPGGVGANWMSMAERIASERTARGMTVVAPELLRAANAMVAKRDTVRIHIQQRVNITPPPQSPPPYTPPGLVPSAAPVGQSAPFSLAAAVPGNGGAAAARRITAVVVPVPPGPRPGGSPSSWGPASGGLGAAVSTGPKSALRAELEETVRLLASNPGLETNALSPAQAQSVREALRPLLTAATAQAPNGGISSETGGNFSPEQKPISLRAQVKL